MDMRQLRYFYTIAQEGQITRAAKKLHMAQPPLSQSLKALETELGVPLLERNGRRMELTKAGKVLYDKAEFFFTYLDETITEVKDTGSGYKGNLSVGCVQTCFQYLPEPIKMFREQYPDITFELRAGDSHYLADQLEKRKLDLAFVRLPVDLKSFSSLYLPTEDIAIVMPESWAKQYDGRDQLTLEELAEIPLVLLKRIHGLGPFELIIDKFNDRGLEPNIVTVCSDIDMVLKLINNEIGASILPANTLKNHTIGEMRSFSIKDESMSSTSAIIWLKNRYLSKSAERFIDFFKQQTEIITNS